MRHRHPDRRHPLAVPEARRRVAVGTRVMLTAQRCNACANVTRSYGVSNIHMCVSAHPHGGCASLDSFRAGRRAARDGSRASEGGRAPAARTRMDIATDVVTGEN